MSRIDFYHLQKQSLEDVLPKLLIKAYDSGKKIKVKIGTAERVEFINALLWTFDDESFLPHGSKKDGFSKAQPIYLSADDDNPNEAEFLFLVDGAIEPIENLSAFTRIFNIFDGNDEVALNAARKYWKSVKESGAEIHYWQQDSVGKWEQKV